MNQIDLKIKVGSNGDVGARITHIQMNQSEERIPRRDNTSSILSKHKRNNNQLACLEIHNS